MTDSKPDTTGDAPESAIEPAPLTYRDAGVDIEAGNALVGAIGPLAKATSRPGVMGALGGFGALFDVKGAGFTDPILVSGTDGVGTKLMVAFETGQHGSVGIDLVAMCANDVLCQGAEPLFFLDYFATGALEPGVAEAVVSGIAEGCRRAGCALIGGETAEMPGMYPPGHYDLAGFVVGAVERDRILPNREGMKAGDALIGMGSSGPHSNGYSLIRKCVERAGLTYDEAAPFANVSLGEALLTPTRLYSDMALPLIRGKQVKGLAHITGGGLTENVPRMLPDGLVALIDDAAWQPLPVFQWLQDVGKISDAEMRRTSNMGIGLVLCVDARDRDGVLLALSEMGEDPILLGELRSK
ncbi:MAG: phosphoribosylformylglycinamidine cyclo-ligase [Pseudomonadota bacterium]